jgi:hypothetical protein
MQVDLPYPNPALTALLLSPRMAEICLERATTAAALYQERVAKRTGELAAEAHAHTEIGGVRHDRHIGVMSVSGPIAYEAAHEFGHIQHGRDPHFIAGAHDLNAVLEELGST